MKVLNSIALTSIVLIGLNGCGGEDSPPVAEVKEEKIQGIPANEYSVQICTGENQDIPACADAKVFDLDKEEAYSLNPPEDIGASIYESFAGKRYLLIPKEEAYASPLNTLIYGLFLYAQEAGDAWCGPCRMAAPASYEEAKVFLKDEFNLSGTDKQNEAILEALNANLERLGKQGLELDEAMYANIKAMAESLVNLTVKGVFPDLSGLKPKEEAYATLDKEMAYETNLDIKNAPQIAYDIRAKSGRLKSYEKAFAKLECTETEDMQINMYGIPDNFNASNSEPTSPSAGFIAAQASVGTLSHDGYDYPAANSSTQASTFMETLDTLPTNLSKGIFVVKLKEDGMGISNIGTTVYFDWYSISADNGQGPNIFGRVSDLRANWDSPSSDLYSKDLSQLVDNSGQTLLSTLQSGQTSLDIWFVHTTSVDFIAVATCKPKPKDIGIAVETIPTKLQCNVEKGEEYFEIWGGVADDFAPSEDVANPSAVLQTLPYLIAYDKAVEKVGNFADTFAHPNSHISQVEVMVNTRASVAGAGNDNIYVGQVPSLSSQTIAIHDANDGTGVTTLNGGMAHFIYGADTVYTSTTTTAGNLLTLLNSNTNSLDVLVSNQTEVDSIRVSMCLIKDYVEPCLDSDNDGVCDDVDCAPKDPSISVGCDDDIIVNPTYPDSCKENFKIDLSQASSWEYNGGHPTVNNVFATYPPNPAWANVIWDGDMTWFDFGSASNAEHKLSIDFCACGNTDVIIDEVKSDNFSKIYLDTDATPSSYTNSGAYITSRSNGISQSTMASWGPNESGSQSITHAGNGVDHTLHFDVKNGFGPSGGAVDGSLSFKGHLGKCTSADVILDDISNPYEPDDNFSISYENSVAIIDYIIFDPIVPGAVGPIDGGTFSIGVKAPIILVSPEGTPVVVPDPLPIQIIVHSANSEFKEPLEAGINFKIACVHDLLQVEFNSQGDGMLHTTNIGCFGEWSTSW